MKVALVYDALSKLGAVRDLPEDFGAEYEDEQTVRSLLAAVCACGYQAVGLALGEDFPRRIRRLCPDLVFNIAEGIRGPTRESVVPAWLDHLDIPYTGSDGLTLAISLDKALTKTIVTALGVRTPRFMRVGRLSELDRLDLTLPLFVKPNAEGSSMGVRYGSRVETSEELRRQVAWVLRDYRQDCIVEEFVPGREFCVGILGNDELQLLPIVEVISPCAFYSYEDKCAHRKELVCPADLPEQTAREMRSMAVKAFRALRCRDLARVDFKLDTSGTPMFLEINPLPGLSPEYSIFPVQAKAAGFAHDELMGRIIELAAKRSCLEREEVAI